MVKEYIQAYLAEIAQIVNALDQEAIERLVRLLVEIKKKGGRVFILGVGGSAGSASHAVNDLRKIAGIEAYAPSDNVSELTARTNDDGWETVFIEWLKTSKLNSSDCLLIFSVGGGSETTSRCLVEAMKLAKNRQAKIAGVVSRDGGQTKLMADVTVLIPVVNSGRITPHAEEFQGVIWHLVVNSPELTQKMVTGQKGAIFLDRDGVLTKLVFYENTQEWDSPRSANDLGFIEGASKAVNRLNQALVPIFLVSNQPGIAKGKFSFQAHQAMTDKLARELALSQAFLLDQYYCLHHPDSTQVVVPELLKDCDCRKPKPGLLVEVAKRYGIDLSSSWIIGDRGIDILAGKAVGSKTILIDNEQTKLWGGEKRKEELLGIKPDYIVASLSEATEIVLRR